MVMAIGRMPFVVSVVLLVVCAWCSVTLAAQPAASQQPLLAPQDVRFGPASSSDSQRYRVHHPVYPSGFTPAEARAFEPGLARYIAMPAEALRALIPTQTGLAYCGCPNCEGGSAENDLLWSPDDPEQVRCRSCGKSYPSPDYPMDRELRVTSPRGDVHVYRYHRDAEGQQYFFDARIWYDKIHYYRDVTHQLAVVYDATKDERYAKAAAVLLDQYARVMPNYVPKYEYPHRPKQFFGAEVKPPYPVAPYRASRYSSWAYGDVPEHLVLAYDLVYNSPALDDKMRSRIETDLIRGSVDWVLLNPERLTNKSPVVWRGMIQSGRVIGEPDYIHDALERARRLVRERFFYDHFWCEGTVSYHVQTVETIRAALEVAKGHTDPEGYISPRDGLHFEDLDPASIFPDLERSRAAAEDIRLPDGRWTPIHDTWWTDKSAPRDRSESRLLPAMGHALLGSGAGKDQVQLHLEFSGGHGHEHNDNLALIFWANGRETFSDLGYTATKLVAWTRSTASHNTVLIDQLDQEAGPSTDGNLLLWQGRGISSVVEVDGRAAYPEASVYRRLLALVERPGGVPFAVDIFRVAGGETHDWFLHGDADTDTELRTDLPLQPFPGSLAPADAPLLPPVNFRDFRMLERKASPGFYGFLADLTRTRTSAAWQLDFVAPGSRTTRLIMVGAPATEVYCGRNPSVRRALDDDKDLPRFTRPFVMARRQAEGRQSVFAALLDPAAGEAGCQVTEVRPLLLDDQAVVLRIACPDTAYLLATCTDPERMVRCSSPEGPVVFQGRYALLRRSGDSVASQTVGVSRVKWGAVEVKGRGRLQGTVLTVSPDAFEIAADNDQTVHLVGRTIIVGYGDGTAHGYQVLRAESTEAGRVRLFVESTGLAYDAAEEVSRTTTYPIRVIPGGSRFTIDLATEGLHQPSGSPTRSE